MNIPTEQDHAEARRRLLVGLAANDDTNELVARVADLHIRRNTFPGETFMQLGANALAATGIGEQRRLNHEDLLTVNLPELSFRGKERQRIQYAVLTTFAVHGGLEPDLLDEVHYWVDEYWRHSLLATVAILNACARTAGISRETLVADLAALHTIDLN